MTTMLNSGDPLAKFKDGARIRGSDHPMPLVNTAIGVRIRGGLAIVRTERTFRNTEDRSIEATITFPVPVHATMVALTASIDGRTLVGRAQRKQRARETYESAIDEGKTAVLHEEALRGVHILSVGHVPPGKEIKVASTWAMPLTRQGGLSHLRVPVTVGDVYGRSPLPDSDDLVHGPVKHEADLTVSSESGIPVVRGIELHGGSARITLDRPIDISVPQWSACALAGIAADGRPVTLTITPVTEDESPLSAALLLDQSGSMGQPAAGAGGPTKHAVMVEGLAIALAVRWPEDRLVLWQFDTVCESVAALSGLWGPRNGTEAGRALAKVAARSDAADIAILTDGMSWSIDVQALARTGKRFTVILVGDDSLEANIGHLAALTGGALFVVPGTGSAGAIVAALASMRGRHVVQPAIDGPLVATAARMAGMDVTAEWGDAAPALAPFADGTGIDPEDARIVGAVAAALAIPHLKADEAGALAESHGIVCHLTSLVLVDDAAEAQDGIPAQRKVPLMTPPGRAPLARAAAFEDALTALSSTGRPSLFNTVTGVARRRAAPPRQPSDMPVLFDSPVIPAIPARPVPSLKPWVGQVNWSDAEALRQGDITGLPPGAASAVRMAATLVEVGELSRALGIESVIIVIALLAKASADADRNAARLFRAVLGKADAALVEAAMRAVGL